MDLLSVSQKGQMDGRSQVGVYLSPSVGLEEGCLHCEHICQLQLCICCQMLECLHVMVGPQWCSFFCLCTHSHTHLYLHTRMLNWKHLQLDTKTQDCTFTLTSIYSMHMQTSSLPVCRCAPLWSCHAPSFLGGPPVPVTTAVTWSMSTFKLKLVCSF